MLRRPSHTISCSNIIISVVSRCWAMSTEESVAAVTRLYSISRAVPGSSKDMDPVIIPALPDAVVALILQYVPLKQRLGPCALVSRSWLDVAASIPPAFITAVLPQQHSCQSLHDWLTAGQRGQHITKLQIALRASTGKPRLFLPCNQLSRLQTLCLKQLDAVLCSSKAATGCCSSSSSSAAVQDAYGQAVPSPAAGVALLPQLRQLQLLQCRISLATLQLLSQLTSLTSLELQGLQVADHMDSTTPVSTAQLSTALTILQEMPRLSDLSLGTSAWEMVPVHIPGSSPSLQRLALTGGFARRSLAGLPASLTCLQLHPSSGSCLHLRAATGLTELASSLRHLQLTKATIPAALLAKLTALQHLSMSSAWAVCAEPGDVGNADELWGYRRFGNSRVKPLLAALQQLPHLQHLVLEYQNSSETLATLTAATQLTAFELAEHGMPFESGALQKAIGSKALPQLRLLRLAAEQRGPSVRPGLHSWDHRDKPSCINDHDIRSITKSCPNLKHLVLHGVVGTNVSTGCLQSLSGLRHLTVSGAAFKDSAAAAVAQIHSLRSLVWGDSPLTVAGLQRLTGLQGLTRLEVVRCPAIDGSCSTAIVCGGTEEDQQGAAGKLVLLCEAQATGGEVCRRLQWWCNKLQLQLASGNKRGSQTAQSKEPDRSSLATGSSKASLGRRGTSSSKDSSSSRRNSSSSSITSRTSSSSSSQRTSSSTSSGSTTSSSSTGTTASMPRPTSSASSRQKR